jgi:hypothetical protein
MVIENFQLPNSVTRKFKIQSPMFWRLNLFSIIMHSKGKVVEADVTHPFCIGCHVSVRLDTFVMFVKTETRKPLVTLELALLQLVTKNRFRSPILQRLKFFGPHKIGTGVVIWKKQQFLPFSQFILPMLFFTNLPIVNPDNE